MADNSELLFFSNYSSLKTLCSVKLQVPKPSGVNIAMASYQPQLIKSREFIFTEPEVIATPLLNSDRRIQIIMQSLFRSGKLQSRCERLGVTVGEPERVLNADFQACLTYTLLARLAPLWNKAGDFLLQGRDFITNNQKLHAIKLDIKVNDNELFLAMKPFLVRLPPITINDLEISPAVLADFMAERPYAVIHEYSIRNKWVYVLPSLKRGTIVSIHHRIPSDSPFKSYRDMKRYWKNTYGYRIPESDEGMLYYQVYFKPIGNKLFTYPECCVRGSDVTILPRADRHAISAAFLADLATKLPAVCGAKLQFSPSGMEFTNTLREATQAESGCNLQTPTTYPRPGVRPPARPALPSTWQPSAHALSHSQQQFNGQKVNTPTSNTSIQSHTANQQRPVNSFNDALNQGHFASQKHSGQNATMSTSVTSIQSSTANQQRPGNKMNSATPKNISDHTQISTLANERNTPDPSAPPPEQPKTSQKLRPVFLPRAKQNPTQKRVPVFKPFSQPAPIFIKEPQQQSPKAAPTFKPKPMFPTKAPAFANKAKPAFPKPNIPIPSLPKPSLVRTPLLNRQAGSGESGYESMVPPSPIQPATPRLVPLPSPSMSSIKSTPVKRKLQGDVGDTPTQKKPRARPKVQEAVDVAALAACHQLGKVNTATLVNWLKEKSVPCKTKDKKGDLVSKVYAHLGLPEP